MRLIKYSLYFRYFFSLSRAFLTWYQSDRRNIIGFALRRRRPQAPPPPFLRRRRHPAVALPFRHLAWPSRTSCLPAWPPRRQLRLALPSRLTSHPLQRLRPTGAPVVAPSPPGRRPAWPPRESYRALLSRRA